MRKLFLPLFVCLMPAHAGTMLEIHTEAGDMMIELADEQAPVTVKNFLRYVDAGAFAGGSFYRVVRDDNQPENPVKIDVIQGGPREGFEEFAEIPLERTRDTGLSHKAGVISMARLGPDTGTAHFFICVEDEPELDFGGRRNPDGQGFAAFGRVIKGMDIVKKIQQLPAEAQSLKPPVRIVSVQRLTGDEAVEKSAAQ